MELELIEYWGLVSRKVKGELGIVNVPIIEAFLKGSVDI